MVRLFYSLFRRLAARTLRLNLLRAAARHQRRGDRIDGHGDESERSDESFKRRHNGRILGLNQGRDKLNRRSKPARAIDPTNEQKGVFLVLARRRETSYSVGSVSATSAMAAIEKSSTNVTFDIGNWNTVPRHAH